MAGRSSGIVVFATVAALALAAGAAEAEAAQSAQQSAEGYSALALGAIVGGVSPSLGAGQKAVLARLFAGDTAAVVNARKIGVEAHAIVCRAGNIDITAFACDLTFGARKVHLSGRSANELYATLAEVGVEEDGAAGTIYRSIYKVSCTIDPRGVAQKDGAGANCAYALNPS